MKKQGKKFTVPNTFKKDKSHFYATNSLLQFPDGGRLSFSPFSNNMQVLQSNTQVNPNNPQSNQGWSPSARLAIEKYGILPNLGNTVGSDLYGKAELDVPYNNPSNVGGIGTIGIAGDRFRHVQGNPYFEAQAGYTNPYGAFAGINAGADFYLGRNSNMNAKRYAEDTFNKGTFIGKLGPQYSAGIGTKNQQSLQNPGVNMSYGLTGEAKYKFKKIPGVAYAKASLKFDPVKGNVNAGDTEEPTYGEIYNSSEKLNFAPMVGAELGFRLPIQSNKTTAQQKAKEKINSFEEAEKARVKRDLELQRYQQESEQSGGAGRVRTAKEIAAMRTNPQLWWESPTGQAEGPAQEQFQNVRGFTPTADFANGGYMAPILPSPMQNPDTPIFRDTTALPFGYGGNMYAKGGPIKPLGISDPKEYERRKAAYDDSLALYNLGEKNYNQRLNFNKQHGIPKSSTRKWNDPVEYKGDKLAKIQPIEGHGYVYNHNPNVVAKTNIAASLTNNKGFRYKKPVQPVYFAKPKPNNFSPIYVTNPLDPRLTAYDDSLRLYNNYATADANYKKRGDKKNAITKPGRPGEYTNDLKEISPNVLVNQSEKNPDFHPTIKPTGRVSYDLKKPRVYKNGTINGVPFDGYSQSKDFINVFKKPVQPVIYKKPEEQVSADVPEKLKPVSINSLSQENKLAQIPVKSVPQKRNFVAPGPRKTFTTNEWDPNKQEFVETKRQNKATNIGDGSASTEYLVDGKPISAEKLAELNAISAQAKQRPQLTPDEIEAMQSMSTQFAYGGNMYPDGGPMKKGPVENQAADFLTKMANSPLFTSRYNTMMKKEASPEEVDAFRQHMVDNINSVDYWPVGYEYTGKPWTDEFGVASYQPARDSFRGNYNILNISDEVNSPSRYTQGIYHPHTIFRKDASPTSTVHELSHASTVSDYMPAKVHVPYSKDPAKAESVAKYSSSNYNRSTEHKAYLDEVRKYLYDNKIYDATTKAFDETDYNNLLKTYENLKLELEKNPDNLELKYLLGAFNKSILPYDKEQNIQLFNSYVDNSSEKSELGNVNIAAYGGTLYSNGGMLKRADGSYSKRGLWDNIRANAGSGKAPTKEMLAQERKINSRQYPGGGQLGSGMLGQNIRQYQNAPKKPLVIDNPRLGPTKQSNQGNTATVIPNSKLPKTLNTVRNPEAEKKALEKQTRELVQSGAASRSLGTLGSSDKSLYEQTQAALLTDPNFLNKVEKNEYKYQQELEQKAYDDASYLQKGVNFGTAFLSNPITTGANLLEGYRPLMNQAEVLRDANNPQNVLMRNTGGLDNIFNAFNPGAYVANYNSNIKKGNYVDAAVDAADILLAPTALGAAGDLKDITKAGEKVSQYFTSKVPTKIGNLTRTPEPFKSELVQRNLNDLKFATEWAKQYGYKLPTESFEKIAQSDKLTDMTIRGLANRHNTFARGVSVENTFLQNLGKFTNDPKAAAEYMATHIPPDTSAGRAGLSKSHGLYTSNSLETAEGYTRNNGYIVRVKKPTYFVGNNRQEWLTDNDFNVTSTDEPLGIQKQSYYSTQPIRGLAEKDYYPRRENFIEQSLKALPEKLLQKLDRSFVNEYEFKSRNLGNALFNKEISRELYEQKEADLWKEYGPRIIELRLTEQNIFKTVQERTDKLRTLHGDALQRRIVTNPYAHYVFMDSVPGRKVLDVVSTKRITPETIKHTSRAHAGNYSHGLTMRSPGFDTTDYVTPFSFRERFGLGPVAQRTAQAKYNNAVANAQNFTLNWYYNGANLRPEVAQKIKALEQSPQDVPKNDFYPSNADLINPDNPMLADTRLDVTTGTKKDIQRLVRNNVIEPDYAKTVRQSFMGSDGLSVPHESFIAALVKTKGPLGIKNVHPDKVEDIMVHEYSGHSGQYLNTGFGPNWNNVLNQEGASYYEPNLSTEAGRFAGSVMRHPKDGTRAWFKAPAELHADLMVARKQVYNEMLNRGINPEISMHMLHNTNSYPEIADELLGKLDRRFFKKTATVAERRKLIGMLPALVGATGAAAYGLTEEQKKNLQSGTQFAYGGSLEGGRKTNLPEDNFMKGGRNIYDSVYASSLGDYYEQGGYLDNQSPVQNINSGVLTASELASRLNRLV